MLVVVLTQAGTAHADLPPAPWQLGQTGTSDTMPREPRAQWVSAFTIDPATPAFLPLRGGNVGFPFALTCAPNELVVGLWGRAGNTIDTLGLLCARMRPNGTLGFTEQRPDLGNAMTPPFTLQCPKHEVIISLRGLAATKVDRLGGRCARVRAWVMQGKRGAVLPSVGGSMGLPFTDECPTGYMLQGVVGFANGTINAIQGLCVPIVT